jgi:hypothetical protein
MNYILSAALFSVAIALFRRPSDKWLKQLVQVQAMQVSERTIEISRLQALVTAQAEMLKTYEKVRAEEKAKIQEIVELLPAITQQAKISPRQSTVIELYQKMEDINSLVAKQSPELAELVKGIIERTN